MSFFKTLGKSGLTIFKNFIAPNLPDSYRDIRAMLETLDINPNA